MNDNTLFKQGITLFSVSIIALILSTLYTGTLYFRIFHRTSPFQLNRMSTFISSTIYDFAILAFLIIILIYYLTKIEFSLPNIVQDNLILYALISSFFLFVSTFLEMILLFWRVFHIEQPRAFAIGLFLLRVIFTVFFTLTAIEMRERISEKNQGKRIIEILSYALIGLAIFTISRPISYVLYMFEWWFNPGYSTIQTFSVFFRGLQGFFYNFTYIYLIIISKWNKTKV